MYMYWIIYLHRFEVPRILICYLIMLSWYVVT